jgi:glutathione S-transferase
MQINPLCQVPTLRLADGSVMTETAAMALMILDSVRIWRRRRAQRSAISFSVC